MCLLKKRKKKFFERALQNCLWSDYSHYMKVQLSSMIDFLIDRRLNVCHERDTGLFDIESFELWLLWELANQFVCLCSLSFVFCSRNNHYYHLFG